MRRRDFIKVIGGTVPWPLAARAQQPRRVGVLTFYSQTDREGQASIAAFLDTFQRLGWTDGRNVRIEYRWGDGDPERAKTELVRSAPDAIMVVGSPALAELQRLTSTIPIVFVQVGDPVAAGLVHSLARPGGNLTGFQAFEPAMGGKWLGVLKEAVPNLSRAAVLFGSDSGPVVAYLRTAETIAPSLGVAVTPVDVVDSGGDRARGRRLCQPAGRRPHRLSTSLHSGEPWIDHHIGGAASIVGNLSVSDFRSRGQPALLRLRSDRFMARGGKLRRSYSTRRKTGR